MSLGIEQAIIAISIAVGTVITVLVERFRRENRKDHNHVMNRLDEVHQDVRDIRSRVDDHIDWHNSFPPVTPVAAPAKKRATRRKPAQS